MFRNVVDGSTHDANFDGRVETLKLRRKFSCNPFYREPVRIMAAIADKIEAVCRRVGPRLKHWVKIRWYPKRARTPHIPLGHIVPPYGDNRFAPPVCELFKHSKAKSRDAICRLPIECLA